MYEKPELTLVGSAANIVLGGFPYPVDNETVPGEIGEGLLSGLDD